MPDVSPDTRAVLDGLLDLTRVTLAVSGKFKSKAEASRLLAELMIPPVRIAAILGVPSADVRSAIAKGRRRVGGGNETRASVDDSPGDESNG